MDLDYIAIVALIIAAFLLAYIGRVLFLKYRDHQWRRQEEQYAAEHGSQTGRAGNEPFDVDDAASPSAAGGVGGGNVATYHVYHRGRRVAVMDATVLSNRARPGSEYSSSSSVENDGANHRTVGPGVASVEGSGSGQTMRRALPPSSTRTLPQARPAPHYVVPTVDRVTATYLAVPAVVQEEPAFPEAEEVYGEARYLPRPDHAEGEEKSTQDGEEKQVVVLVDSMEAPTVSKP